MANNRIITLQEEMERGKEESSYFVESSRKVKNIAMNKNDHSIEQQ